MWNDYGQYEILPNLEVLLTVLGQMAEMLKWTWIFIDALHEVEPSHRPQILFALNRLLSFNVSILVTSRPCENLLSAYHPSCIELGGSNDGVAEDIRIYVSNKVHDSMRLGRHLALREEIIQQLCERAQGS